MSTLLRGNYTVGLKTTVHIGEVSTVHFSESYLIGLYKENKRAGQKVSIWVGCPQRWSVHMAGFYCIHHQFHQAIVICLMLPITYMLVAWYVLGTCMPGA